MKFAYADPPYLGCGARIYGFPEWDHPERHRQLIGDLCRDYSDGWAMSLHTPSLKTILAMCPDDVRIACWCKNFAQIRKDPQWMWEPVIWRGGRDGRRDEMCRDWIVEPAPFVRPRENPFPGQKPRAFCRWIFNLLGAKRGDELVDLFPGSGAVLAAWAEWVGERSPLPELPLLIGQ